MFTSFRHLKDFYNRRVSVILAIMIGILMGIGAFVVWQKTNELPVDSPTFLKSQHTKGPLVTQTNPGTNMSLFSAASLTPYKALYTVQLTDTKGATDIIDIQGKMMYQLGQSCEQTVTDHHYILTYYYPDSVPMRISSDFSMAESHKGGQFDFTARRRRDGVLYEELRGRAVVDPKKGGEAIYTDPEDMRFDLPPDTRFLAGQTAILISAAQQGQKFLSFPLFDGSDKDGPLDVTALISSVPTSYTPPGGPNIDATLLTKQAWRVHLAFFSRLEPQETSDYEMTITLHANGVISSSDITYPDYTVKETLTALKPQESSPCDPSFNKPASKPAHMALPPDMPDMRPH
jgi:hypothetical protein